MPIETKPQFRHLKAREVQAALTRDDPAMTAEFKRLQADFMGVFLRGLESRAHRTAIAGAHIEAPDGSPDIVVLAALAADYVFNAFVNHARSTEWKSTDELKGRIVALVSRLLDDPEWRPAGAA